MLATFRFIKRTGDGYFGRLDYQDVVCPNVEIRDLDHAVIKARATMYKHMCMYNVQNAYAPYCFVTLPDGTVYRITVLSGNKTETIKM